jgi:hypothetical protein
LHLETPEVLAGLGQSVSAQQSSNEPRDG